MFAIVLNPWGKYEEGRDGYKTGGELTIIYSFKLMVVMNFDCIRLLLFHYC